MAPNYKLYYFNVTGRAEPIRMLFSYGGIQFEDIRIEREDWPKVKPTTPLGQVPVLEIDGKKITQGQPIARYVANLVNLAGNNNDENLEIDVAVEITSELLKTGYEFRFEPDEARKKKIEEKLLAMLPQFLAVLEEGAKKNGGYLAANRITWADIVLLCAYEDLRNILGNKDILADYPQLQEIKKNLLQVPNLRSYIQNRPKIPMYIHDLKTEL